MINTVFIHGAGGNSQQWQPLCEHLTRVDNFQFYELPGHGDRAEELPATLDEVFEDFEIFANELGAEPIYLIAHSMGGLVAIDYAAKYPDKVNRLVLISTAAKILIHPELLQQLKNKALDVEFLQEGFSPSISDANKALVINSMKQLNITHDCDDFMGVSSCDKSDFLMNIKAPTLIICGENDRIVSRRRTRELEKKLPLGVLKMIAMAAHYPHLEQIEQTAQYINEFCVGVN